MEFKRFRTNYERGDAEFQSLIGIKWNLNPIAIPFTLARALFQSLIGIKWNLNSIALWISAKNRSFNP